jgi:NADPH-dependent curcumin reductase CurA
MNKVIILNERPQGKPAVSNFKITSEELPATKDGEVLLKQFMSQSIHI